MLDKVKKMNQLRKMQSEMEKQLEDVHSTVEKVNMKVTVNANNKILSIQVSGHEEKLLVNMLNEALKDAKKKAQKQMQSQMGELGLGDLLS